MLTSKQRAYLRGLAAKEDTILQIGKDGITEKTAETMSDMLRARELVKGRVQAEGVVQPADEAVPGIVMLSYHFLNHCSFLQ